MTVRYWVQNAEAPEWILRNYMEMTDYAYRHADLGMLDIDYAELPENERLDAAAEGMLVTDRAGIEAAYTRSMAELLDGFFNMPADGRYAGRENEGKVTDLTEREGFRKVFVSADRHMSEDFIKEGGHAWDGMLDGCPLRYIKDPDGKISLMQLTSASEHKRFYKIRRSRRGGLFALCHAACEIYVGEDE